MDKIIKLIDDVEHLQDSMLASPSIDGILSNFFRINLFFFFPLGIKHELEEKMNEIKSLGHNIRMRIKRKKYF